MLRHVPGSAHCSTVFLHASPRYSIGVETRGADIVVQRDIRPSGVLKKESRANKTLSECCPHDLQASPGICNTLPLGTSPSTMQQPFHFTHPTQFIGVVSNKSTRNGGDITQGVLSSTEETLQTRSPYQLYHPHQPGTALAPTHYTGVAFSTRHSIPTMPLGSISSSAAALLPSTASYPNGRDHGITRSSSQQDTTQELNSCAEYVAPSKGTMSGGVEVTIVGTNFPHTLSLSVYFSTKPAVIVSREYLARGQTINAEPLPDSKDSRDPTMFGSCHIISRNC
jgi:hypothetical protein